MAYVSNDYVFYHQTKTSFDFWYKRELNLKSLIVNSLLILYGCLFRVFFFFFYLYPPTPESLKFWIHPCICLIYIEWVKDQRPY